MKRFLLIFILVLPLLLGAKNTIKYKYYRTGEVKSELLKQSNNITRIICYYKNGIVKSISHYKNGYKHGLWQNFKENGQQVTNAFFFKNKKDGYWTFYDLEGSTHCALFYKSNKVVKVLQSPPSAIK